MNEPAVRLEEQIISLFSNLETEIYQGWILKQTSRKAVVYPLYGASLCRQDIIDRIKMFEEISRQKHLSCEFRIVEHTNYYLASLLEDSKIIVDIPDNEKLLASYRESGFHKAYLYRCYQKEDL